MGAGRWWQLQAQLVRPNLQKVGEGIDSERGRGGCLAHSPCHWHSLLGKDLPAFRVHFTFQVGTSNQGTGTLPVRALEWGWAVQGGLWGLPGALAFSRLSLVLETRVADDKTPRLLTLRVGTLGLHSGCGSHICQAWIWAHPGPVLSRDALGRVCWNTLNTNSPTQRCLRRCFRVHPPRAAHPGGCRDSTIISHWRSWPRKAPFLQKPQHPPRFSGAQTRGKRGLLS